MILNYRIAALTLIAVFCGMSSAVAQSSTPTEAVQPNGSIVPPLALTPAQRNAIYNDVERQRVHTPAAAAGIAARVGAPAPPSLALGDLPGVPAVGGDAADLKYATVAGDIVVVDPIRMRVVEVIHSGSTP